MSVLARTELTSSAPSGSWHSVIERFETVAAAHPGRLALICGGERVTFGELAARSSAVTAGLAARGAGAESVVGLLLPRGADLVAGLLGVLRSGASYLPLDPALPEGRLTYMCGQAGVELILADTTTASIAPSATAERVVTIDACARATPAGASPPSAPGPAQRAYVIYTSGSTGRPKGVEVTHGSLVALLDGLAAVVGGRRARVGWNASPSFDASVQQWLRLCRGDTVVLIEDQVRRDPQALAALIAEESIDEVDMTPSHAATLLDYLPHDRRPAPLRLLIGGEAIGPGLWERLAALRAEGVLDPVNLYGPTECTVDCTFAPVDQSGGPHLGAPLPGARVHLLDDELRTVAPGVEGELYVAGLGVSRGYLAMPALTAERFVPDTVAGDGGRMYRTGDRARIGHDGRMEFLGRRDDQVKVRGYRIELGEVEAVLSRCPGVAQAAAVVRPDLPGGAGLVGYCQPRAAADGRSECLDLEAVRRNTTDQLPDYMVPPILVALDRLPLTVSGKVDRAALPSPLAWRPRRSEAPPRSPMQRLLVEAWREVLEVDDVSVDDDFFELGGQSLLAIRLVARLRRQIGQPIPLVAVFKYPVLHQLAGHLDEMVRPALPRLQRDRQLADAAEEVRVDP